MPCNDGGVPYPPTEKEQLDAKAVQMLCGICRALSSEDLKCLLNDVDWKEAGVKRSEFLTWWKLHRAEDEARIAAELEATNKERLRLQALSKLTKEERAALGV